MAGDAGRGGIARLRGLARAFHHEVEGVTRLAHSAPDACRGPDRRRDAARDPALGPRDIPQRGPTLADGEAGAAQVFVGSGVEAVALRDRVGAGQGDLRVDHGPETLEREGGEADRRRHRNGPHGDPELDAESAAVAEEKPHRIGPEIPRDTPLTHRAEPDQRAACRRHIEAEHALGHRAEPSRAEEGGVLRCRPAHRCHDAGKRAEERSPAPRRAERVVERAPGTTGLGGHPAVGFVDVHHPVERAHVEDDGAGPRGPVAAGVGVAAAPHRERMARPGDRGNACDGRVHARRAHDEVRRV